MYRRYLSLIVIFLLIAMITVAQAANTLTVTGEVVNPVPPTADFSASPVSGPPPLTVYFQDTSTGSPAQWEWDFENDGIVDSGEQNPTHMYPIAGTYSVSLKVTNSYGTDTLTREGYIEVSEYSVSERIDALHVYVEALDISDWGKKHLLSPLDKAEKMWDKGNERATIAQMDRFITKVYLFAFLFMISPEDAAYMINEAQEIIDLIGDKGKK
ncbi:MAG: hypothetical protein APR55_04015 [Methanolinea sp. SDB]|nr:MAG: hypothetical protein APR55_04015 [Methanolinea sp. SDB]